MSKGLSQAKKSAVFEKYEGRCAYCGKELTTSNFHIDHINPKSCGGGNETSNLNPSCANCNASKSDKDLEDYRLFMMIRNSAFNGIITTALWRLLQNRGVMINLPIHIFHYETEAA